MTDYGVFLTALSVMKHSHVAHSEARQINSLLFICSLFIRLSFTLFLEVEIQLDMIFASKFTKAFGKQNLNSSQTREDETVF